MKNASNWRPKGETEKPDNIRVFDEWYNKTIQNTVTEGMQLVHKIINEDFFN